MDDGFDGFGGGDDGSPFRGGSGPGPQPSMQQQHVNVYSQLQLSQKADVISRICQLLLGDEFYREQLVTLLAAADAHMHLGVNVRRVPSRSRDVGVCGNEPGARARALRGPRRVMRVAGRGRRCRRAA